MYTELTDIKAIVAAQRIMHRHLKRCYSRSCKAVIGWPAGTFSTKVHHEPSSVGPVSWWYSGTSSNGSTQHNLFGQLDPTSPGPLFIDLQFNFPIQSFNRRCGGAFVMHRPSRRIFLAHRGIVTRGRSRLNRDRLLEEADVTTIQADTDVGRGPIQLIMVSPVDNPDLPTAITDFSTEIRRAANVVIQQEPTLAPSNNPRSGELVTPNIDLALSQYYDEFAGSRASIGPGVVVREWRHGLVVKALRQRHAHLGKPFKSQAVDLVIETPKEIWLFEVKTSADTQSLYTAIGQLYFHGAALQARFPGKKLVRYLVVPTSPSARKRQDYCQALGLEVLTFTDDGETIRLADI